MSQVMLGNADSQLAHLVEQVSRREKVIILRDSIPIAKLIPLPEDKPKELQGGFGSGRDALIYYGG